MKNRIQIRIGGLSSDDWRSDFQSRVEHNDLQTTVELLGRDSSKRPGSTAAVDPQIVVAAITGGAAIIVALIPIIADIFRKKSNPATMIVNVTLHGTANSQSLQIADDEISEEKLDEVFASIGSLTEIDVS